MPYDTMASFYADKITIITGAASGIGFALSQELCAQGAVVVLADKDAAGLSTAIASLGDARLRATPAVVDVTDAAAVSRLIQDVVARHGRLDYLFNNAGIGVVGDARDLSIEDWRTVIETNLFGTVHGVAAAYPVMTGQGFGHIVNTASLAGLVPSPGEISYSASKYAVVGLSESLRIEAGDLGVKVSVVCPGLIDTPLLRNFKLIGIDRQQLLQLLPGLMAPERCAREILRGVERNRPVILVTSMAWWFWRINRISPGLMRWIWLGFARKVRKLRKEK
jgi:NAD(P)-dependent dehydrogenase (short-subunit alcohol dehydrogenase family)